MSLGMRAIKVSISVSKCTQICWLSTNSEHFKIIDIEVENIEVVRFYISCTSSTHRCYRKGKQLLSSRFKEAFQ